MGLQPKQPEQRRLRRAICVALLAALLRTGALALATGALATGASLFLELHVIVLLIRHPHESGRRARHAGADQPQGDLVGGFMVRVRVRVRAGAGAGAGAGARVGVGVRARLGLGLGLGLGLEQPQGDLA